MTEYYVNPNGNDKSSGSMSEPWQSLARVNEAQLKAGDRIFLQGAHSYAGSLLFINLQGSAEKPIIVSSYGSGRARIEPGKEGGILLWNSGGFHIHGIDVVGVGYPDNYSHGVCLYADKGGVGRWESILLEDLDISGFGCAGVAIGARGRNGFRNVNIKNIRSHHNAYAGIFAWGEEQEHCHQQISLFNCQTFFNTGVPGLIHPSGHGIHSGHGILLSGVDEALVERCISHDNGAMNTSHNCGPAGIWASNSRAITFRKNESFRNCTAAATDGGGFGFDGGVHDSLMEDNYSHENDGPGYLFAQYYGAKPFRNNKIVNNISENDGRHNDNGSIHIWGPADDPMHDLLIQGNEVRLNKESMGRPRALFIDARTHNLKILDNKFLAGSMVPICMEVAPLQKEFVMAGNLFESDTSGVLWHGRFYKELREWLESHPQGPLVESSSP